MTATITIQMSDEILAALRKSGSFTVNLGSGESAPVALPARRGRKPGRRAGGATRTAGSSGLREGSHGARLVAWARERGASFTTPDVMKVLKIKRGHAQMVLAQAMKAGLVVREGRGVYALRS